MNVRARAVSGGSVVALSQRSTSARVARKAALTDPLTRAPLCPPDGGAGASSTASGTGGAGGGGDRGPNELPCDVRAVLEEVCVTCHSSPVTSGALLPLVSRYDFLAKSSVTEQTVGERAVERMNMASSPMPPKSEPPAPAEHLTVMEQWVAAGMPAGTCGAIPPKPAETTCTSGELWDEKATPTAAMNPGQPCRACHKTKAAAFNYFFMGTVFPTFHEEDLCISPPTLGGKIGDPRRGRQRDDDPDAERIRQLHVERRRGRGPASLQGTPGREWADTGTMTKAQTDGDCNKCHTEQGAEDAPGRLTWPGTYDRRLRRQPRR